MQARLEAGAWDQFFLGIVKTMSNPTKILRAAMATRGYRAILDKFKQQRGPDGAWPERSASTQERYRAIQAGTMPPPPGFPRAAFNPSNRLLVLTGALRKTLSPGELAQNTANQGANAILMSSPLGYSGDMNDGDLSRNIPARPFMWLDEKELDETSDIVLKLALGEA